MTTQDAYEKIRAYFARPGATLAKNDQGGCFYRVPETGAGCAVGCLIPDSMYVAPNVNGTNDREKDGMECGMVNALFEAWPVVKGYLFDVEVDFLRKAQRLHDSHADNAQSFVVMLDLLAAASGLEVSSSLAQAYTPVAA